MKGWTTDTSWRPGRRGEGRRADVKARVIGAVVLLLAAVAVGTAARTPRGLTARYPDGLRLGYAAEAPYAFVDEHGRVTGAIPELARHVADRLGLPVTFVQTDFGSLLDQLEEGRYDVVASGLFITAQRAQRVRFSTPTFQAADAALVRRGNPRRLHSLDDVRTAGAAVVVLAASVEEALVRRAGIPPERTIAVPDAAAARRALESGDADLFLNSEPTVQWMSRRDAAGTFEVAAPFIADASSADAHVGGFAFRLGDDALVAAWNRVLGTVVGTPAHVALIEPFGFTRRSLPSMTAGEPSGQTTP